MDIKIGRFHITAGTQYRGDNGLTKPWLGFTYGSFLPKFWVREHTSGWYFNWYWLCFHGDVLKIRDGSLTGNL